MANSDVDIIREKESNRQMQLSELRNALKRKGIGEDIEFEDSFLIKFLRAKVYHIEKTCDLIKMYIWVVRKYPEIFRTIRPSRRAIENNFFQVVPDRNVTGEVITIMSVRCWNPSETSFIDAISSTVYAFEMAEMDEETQLKGAIEIVDMGDVTVRQMMKIGVSELRMSANFTEHTLPIRWRKIFVCYENWITDALYAIARPFLSKEMIERVEFVGTDMTKIHELVPLELLPARYGGTSTRCEGKLFYKKLEAFEPQLQMLWEKFE